MELNLSLPFLLPVILGSCLIVWLILRNCKLNDENHMLQKAFNQVVPICITNNNYEIVSANDAYWTTFSEPTNKNQPIKCFEHRPGKACHSDKCPLTQIIKGQDEFLSESQKETKGKTRVFIVTARPFYGKSKKVKGVIESFQDITDIKELENEKSKLILALQESLEKVKLLSGLIPICASCKQIRDDKGFWNNLESYITKNSEAVFSHGICPKCANQLYPQFFTEFPDK